MEETDIRRRDHWYLVAGLVAAIALRGLVVWLRADELTADRDVYLGIARGVAEARGFCSPGSTVPTAFRPPLYPLMLAGLMVAVPAGVAVAFVNGLFGVAAVWATWRASQCLGLGRAGLLAALLVGVDPLLLRYTSQPMTETTCAGLVALLLLATVSARVPLARGFARQCSSTPLAAQSCRQCHPIVLMLLAMVSNEWQNSRREWAVGALFGLLVLCRPTFWPLAGLMVAAWSLNRWRGSCGLEKATIGGLGAAGQRGLPWRVAVATMLVVSSWLVRNQLVFGVPLLTTTHGGYTLLLANNSVFYDEVVDQPWGTVWQGDSLARWQSEQDERLERDLGPRASEIERDARLNAIAWKFIAAEPRRFLRATWHRLRSLWSTVPHGDAGDGTSRWLIEAVGWYSSFVLLAFVIGMVVVARRPDRGRWWLPYALVITVQAVHLVYWTNARMRAPLTPVISLFAAAILAPRVRPVPAE